jgi:hypothetical protein
MRPSNSGALRKDSKHSLDAGDSRSDLFQKLQSLLTPAVARVSDQARHVPTRTGESRHEPFLDGVGGPNRHDDRIVRVARWASYAREVRPILPATAITSTLRATRSAKVAGKRTPVLAQAGALVRMVTFG